MSALKDIQAFLPLTQIITSRAVNHVNMGTIQQVVLTVHAMKSCAKLKDTRAIQTLLDGKEFYVKLKFECSLL